MTNLLSALHAFQQEAPTLPKDGSNPHFHSKFTKLDTIVETVSPLLTKHGLVWTTLPSRDEHGDPSLKYRLAHAESGEALDGEMPLLLTKEDPQGMGSAITYARRYSVCAVLNLVADEDDDGNAGSKGSRPRTTAGRAGPATKPQLTRIKRDLKGLSWAEIKATFAQAGVEIADVKAIDGISRAEASAVIDRIAQGALPSESSEKGLPGAGEGEFEHEPVTPEEIAEAFPGSSVENA